MTAAATAFLIIFAVYLISFMIALACAGALAVFTVGVIAVGRHIIEWLEKVK